MRTSPSRRRCTECNLFLKNEPNHTEYDSGCDVEYDPYDHITIKTGWRTTTDVRICKGCGHENREDVAA